MEGEGKARHLAVLCLAVVLVLSVWFAGTAAVPRLIAEGLIAPARAGSLTMAVQLGFVVGTLVSAVLSLADRRDPRRLFLASALLASAVTLAQTTVEPSGFLALVLRFLAGAAMAGVYPVGMKLAASWAKGDLGLLIGLLVGAVTLGSALPHLAPTLLTGLGWQAAYLGAGVLAAAGGLLILAFRPGPIMGTRPPFRPAQALEAWRNKGLRLANLGYLGHMWELYAMWAWVGLFLAGVLGGQAGPWTFAVVACGALGCVAAGLLADRWNRASVAALAMLVSGACALLAGPATALGPAVVLALALVWGFAVVADSAQFSACVVTLSPPDYVGTMLTVQTSLGFLLTALTIFLVPAAVGWLGWDWAFAVLAPGPLLGAVAMLKLRPLLNRA
ncbi:MFS transporter [Roseomonas stagni]|uniref:MFS transporter n=1 Tax=Falsiroseomonas algicola TaxID=2716930 RepID=A0A6M1LIE6_9PROT|nr:MFS transporter [Falsiroseomonas algicola]NGM20118.1 MFS transporter [Falsiroseomonas algicola]